ncbi:hypothetical protein ScPMuIL_017735 [Solemya velum]
MSSIVVCNRTTRGKSDRIKLNLVNLKGRVISLKNEVAKAVGLQPRDLELIYCGRCLGDDRVLEASGVKSGSTVFALRKHGPPKEATPEPLSDMATHQLVKTLQAALINPAYRTTVDRLLNTQNRWQGSLQHHQDLITTLSPLECFKTRSFYRYSPIRAT